MKDGFVKVGAAVPELRVADCAFNAEKIIEIAKKAEKAGTFVLVFPELSVTGATCGDLFLNPVLLDAAEKAVENIAAATSDLDMLIFVGAPVRVRGRVYDCAVAINHGSVLGISPSAVSPDRADANKFRYFGFAPDFSDIVDYAGFSCVFGVNVIYDCEALKGLSVASVIGHDLEAAFDTLSYHCAAGASLIAVLASSPETVSMPEHRRKLLSVLSAKNSCAAVYASAGCGESTTDCVYSGHSLVYECGKLLAENEPFDETELVISEPDTEKIAFERSKHGENRFEKATDYAYVDFETELRETTLTRTFPRRPFIPENENEIPARCEYILRIQAAALAKRIKHINSKNVVIGISGGLDSTLALIVSVLAMKRLGRPASDVLAVTMPCFGTGKRTRSNAETLCLGLGVDFRCVDITASVKQHLADIGHDETTYDVTYENSQARERTQVLMDIANATGGIVIGTGDLSEAALGWCTFNGDHMANYDVNCSIPKTLIRYIVKYYADACGDEKLKTVLYDILDTPVSPELVPSKPGEISQKTEKIIGDYDLHDFFLYYFIHDGYSPEKLYRIACHAFDGVFEAEYIKSTLETFVRRFFTQQFKRSCTPDGVKTGSVALSPRGSWLMPSDASFGEWKF